MKNFLLGFLLFLIPYVSSAQTLSAQSFITKFLTFSNRVLIPFALGIAFLFFLINVIRFFVVNGAEEEGRKNAKNLAIYSVLAFVVLIVFWGVINLLAGSTTLNGQTAPTPDYVQKNEGNANRNRGNSTGAGEAAAPTTPGTAGTPTTPSTGGGTDGQPENLLPPGFGGGPEVVPIDPCDNGGGFTSDGVPCRGIY